jgi:hypothetical protein
MRLSQETQAQSHWIFWPVASIRARITGEFAVNVTQLMVSSKEEQIGAFSVRQG